MRSALPKAGRDWPAVKAEMLGYAAGDVRWREGKTAVYVFNAGADVEQVQKEAYVLFMSENGLGPAAFPSLKRMEEEVIGFGLELFHAPSDARGTITSGGTDSITMAVKAARDFARKKRGVAGPLNVVLPRSAHPAFDKACALMEIEVRRTPLRDYLADPAAMAEAADAATVMIVGSAPNFPYGLIDPIAALSDLAVARDLWLHVDACVGGYMAPFVRMDGADVPPFDFELPGVRSMSADLHKHAYAPKGVSTLIYRDADLLNYQSHTSEGWAFGAYRSTGFPGSRPSHVMAAAWAILHHLGEEGYLGLVRRMYAARDRLMQEIAAMPGMYILGAPESNVFAFTSDCYDPHAVAEEMASRGWYLARIRSPRGLHIQCDPFDDDMIDRAMAALRDCVDVVAAKRQQSETEYTGY